MDSFYSPFTDANFDFNFYPPALETSFAEQAETLTPGIVSYAQQIATAGESIIEAVARAMATVNMSLAQRDFLSLQIDRARQGLPPLNVSQYTPTTLPDGTVQYVPEKKETISGATLVALGLGAFALLKK